MLLGHIGVGLAGKKFAPGVSLGTLILAAEFADLVWIVLSLAGIEHFRIVANYTLMSWYDMYDTPFSHGLAANFVLAIVFGATHFLFKKDLRSSLILAGVVLSHWVLDFITHRPDMVLINRSWPLVGLGLWWSFLGTILVETGLYVVGLLLYVSVLRKRSRRQWGRIIPFVLFCAFLMACSLVLKPMQDPLVEIEGCGIMLVLLVVIAYWSEARKQTRPSLIKYFIMKKMKHRYKQTP